jgi:hypothetical protein
MSNSKTLKITVTHVRNKSVKSPKPKSKLADEFAEKLLDVMQDPDLYRYLEHPDLFMAVMSTAIDNLRKA